MKIKKVLTCLLCASIVGTSLCACGDGVKMSSNAVYAAELDSDEQILTDVVTKLVNAGTSDASKEETVYVKTTADGTVDSIVVSNWLKNAEATEELEDSSELENITNVKGKETFTRNGNDITWNAEGSDIYYQGTTDKQLPVDVNITYELDGKTVSAEEIAGKSGHVVITVNYKNNEAHTTVIAGKETTIYTPFVAVSGMALDTEKFTNVTVSNGTVVSDGKRQIAVGMAFPGLVDSLNGSKIDDNELLDELEEKVDIPGKVEIEADVTNFETGMVLTMVSSDVTSALGLDSLDLDSEDSLDNVKDSINEFTSAGDELVEGTTKLKDGAQTLSDGTKDLVSGTGKLHDGIVTYTDGVGKVASGASKLDSGASELQTGINQVGEGMSSLSNGINQVNTGAKSLSEGATSLESGAQNVANGASQVSSGVDSLVSQVSGIASGVGTAASAANQISGGIDQIVAATSVQTNPEDIDVSGISVSGTISGEDASNLMLTYITADTLAAYGLDETEIQAVLAVVSQVSSQVIPGVADSAATQAARSATAQGAASGANTAKAQINAAITSTVNGVSLQSGASQLATSLSDSYATLASEETAAQLTTLSQGAAALSTGASQLAQGTTSLSDGADKLYEGTQKLASGAGQLSGGISELSAGASTLKEGTAALSSGASELSANSGALIDGSKTLADGSVTLVDGIKQLLEGTITLNDGMIQFNEEGIKELSSLFDTDLSGMSERIKAIADAGKAYNSYSGTKATENCSVKFIIESEGIK